MDQLTLSELKQLINRRRSSKMRGGKSPKKKGKKKTRSRSQKKDKKAKSRSRSRSQKKDKKAKSRSRSRSQKKKKTKSRSGSQKKKKTKSRSRSPRKDYPCKKDRLSASWYYRVAGGQKGDICEIREGQKKYLDFDKNGRPVWKNLPEDYVGRRCRTSKSC